MGQSKSKAKQKGTIGSIETEPEKPIDCVNEIRDEETWQKVCHSPQDRAFARTEVVKVVIYATAPKGHNGGKNLYFLQSVKWIFHHTFCNYYLHHPGAKKLSSFNAKNYLQDDRDFILGTVIHYKDQDIYTFEIVPRDTLRGEKIHEAFEQIKASVFFGDKLRFRPLSERHRESLATLGKDAEKLVPTIESAVLFAAVKYQPLTVGTCYGCLTLIRNTNNALQQHQKEEREKKAEGEKEPTKKKSKKNRKGEDEGEEDEDAQVFKCGWNDILLCEDVPNDIPVVAGLITGQLQTPLCHVALLCSNRWTPNMGLIEAWKDPRLTPLIGKWVRLTVDMQDFTIEEVTEEETRQWQREKIRALREGANIELPCNVEDVGGLVTFKQLQAKDKTIASYGKMEGYIGSKAQQLVKVAKLHLEGTNSMATDHAYVIPFYYYHQHVTSACQKELKDLLDDASTNDTHDAKDYEIRLKHIRKSIKKAKVDESLTDSILKQVADWKNAKIFEADGMIFRSSTNVEDIEGFNGAGLYESKPIKKESCEDPSAIATTLRFIWASVWNFRGFEERRLYGINSDKVQMAVLVQPWFKEKVYCNGVALTTHPFRSDFDGHFINVQIGGRLVTDNCDGESPEQVLIWGYMTGPIGEKLSSSSLVPEGESIISKKDVERLAAAFNILHREFRKQEGDDSTFKAKKQAERKEGRKLRRCVDIEFLLLDKDKRELLVLQCRPFIKIYNLTTEG